MTHPPPSHQGPFSITQILPLLTPYPAAALISSFLYESVQPLNFGKAHFSNFSIKSLLVCWLTWRMSAPFQEPWLSSSVYRQNKLSFACITHNPREGWLNQLNQSRQMISKCLMPIQSFYSRPVQKTKPIHCWVCFSAIIAISCSRNRLLTSLLLDQTMPMYRSFSFGG